MSICEYGCGQEAKYQFKNGKWCCGRNMACCPAIRKRNSARIKEIYQDPNSVYNTASYKKKMGDGVKKSYEDPKFIELRRKESTGKKQSKETIKKKTKSLKETWKDPNSGYNLPSYKDKQSNGIKKAWKDPDSQYNSNLYKVSQKLTIEKINIKYSFFLKIEEMRYNPNKPDERKIQVHCKNHNCKNSKEKGGWFTPTYSQIYERIRALEKPYGMIENNFYCCQECKDICPLYNLKEDPLKENNLPYTSAEYQTFRTFVLERDNYICQYCGKPATHVHHERPQKLEPFYALDPDYAWSCCEKCHYEKGHKEECSTGNLAKIVCSTESQKFLDQKI